MSVQQVHNLVSYLLLFLQLVAELNLKLAPANHARFYVSPHYAQFRKFVSFRLVHLRDLFPIYKWLLYIVRLAQQVRFFPAIFAHDSLSEQLSLALLFCIGAIASFSVTLYGLLACRLYQILIVSSAGWNSKSVFRIELQLRVLQFCLFSEGSFCKISAWGITEITRKLSFLFVLTSAPNGLWYGFDLIILEIIKALLVDVNAFQLFYLFPCGVVIVGYRRVGTGSLLWFYNGQEHFLCGLKRRKVLFTFALVKWQDRIVIFIRAELWYSSVWSDWGFR